MPTLSGDSNSIKIDNQTYPAGILSYVQNETDEIVYVYNAHDEHKRIIAQGGFASWIGPSGKAYNSFYDLKQDLNALLFPSGSGPSILVSMSSLSSSLLDILNQLKIANLHFEILNETKITESNVDD